MLKFSILYVNKLKMVFGEPAVWFARSVLGKNQTSKVTTANQSTLRTYQNTKYMYLNTMKNYCFTELQV